MAVQVELLDGNAAVLTSVDVLAARGLIAGAVRAGAARAVDATDWIMHGDRVNLPIPLSLEVRLATSDLDDVATALDAQVDTLRDHARATRSIRVISTNCHLRIPVRGLTEVTQTWRGPTSITMTLSWLRSGLTQRATPLSTDAGQPLLDDSGERLYGLRAFGGGN